MRRKPLGKKQAHRTFRKGRKSHKKNFRSKPMRGGIRA